MGKEVIVGHSYGKSYRPAAFGWLMPAPRSWRKLHDEVRLMFATAENEYQTEDGGNRIALSKLIDLCCYKERTRRINSTDCRSAARPSGDPISARIENP
jgi:hypothetical protein